MKKFLNLFSAVLVCLVLNQTTVTASSHREAPLISFDPLADNTDVYAFRSPVDTNKVVLIANYIPFELPQGGPNYYTFGPNIRYEIHVKNTTGAGDDFTYRFTFQQKIEDSTTFFNIRLGKQNLKTTYTLERGVAGVFTTLFTDGVVPPNNIGPRSIDDGTTGLGSAYETLATNAIKTVTSTGERFFCGPRDDPFFVDLGGAFDVGGFRTPGRDGLAKFNVHSIVVEVPIATLSKNKADTKSATSILDPNYIIGVWASASRQATTVFDSTTGGPATTSGAFVQVSRLGMPLTNEVINHISQKDKWNSVIANSAGESLYNSNFTNPEVALYMDDSKFGGAVPGLSKLRIQSKSLGTYDFRNTHKGLYDLKRSPAVVGTAFDSTTYGPVLLPDSVSPRSVDILPIFYTGVPNLRPYQLATGKPAGSPLSAGKPFINNFLPTLGDMLRLNMAVPVTPRNSADFSSLGLVQAAVLGLTDARFTASGTALQNIPNMDGFPNGRRLEDDVVTISLQALSGVVLAAIGLWYDDYTVGTSPSPVTTQLSNVLGFNAGVVKNDTTLRVDFPFEQTPWRGFLGASYSGTLIGLPLDWMSFVAEKDGNTVNLKWIVANEVNDDHFEVQYSLDGSTFAPVGTVKAINGANNQYAYTHVTPSLDKVNYYRIKQIDKDGRFTYSEIRAVKFNSETSITVLPNPATDFIKVFSKQSRLTVNLFDGNGRKIDSKVITNGYGQFNVARLPKGAYYIVAESDGVKLETKKIMKQ